MSKKTAQQVEYGKKPAKVPVIMQLEMMECGAACLTMILAYYGKWITLEEAREDCGVSRDGQNAFSIIQAGRKYGLKCNGSSMGIKAFKNFKEFPCIVHWNLNHYVVVNGIKNDKVYINDPAVGLRKVSIDEFKKCFTGIVLTMRPDEGFSPSGRPKSIRDYAGNILKGTTAAALLVVISTIISNIVGVVNPIFSKVFMDRLLTGRNPDWLTPFTLLFISVSIISFTASWINAICSMRISGKMAVVGNSSFMWKALNLPMKFYSQRIVGDIQSRQNSAANISHTLINTLSPIIINTAMMVFYLCVMLRQSIVLSMLGISSIVINYLLSAYITKKRVNISRTAARDSGKLYSTTTSGIEMIETIKAAGVETGYFQKWAGYQSLVNTSAIKSLELNRNFGMLPTIVFTLNSNLVLLIGIYLVIIGEFTCGSVMAFQGLVSSFMAPAMTLISSNQKILEMHTEMERLEDVMQYPEENLFAAHADAVQSGSFEKLGGKIELKDVTFGYSPLDTPLIDHLNITITPGSKIAFVGKSGCGKSTIAKLISGIYKPWSGQILFDGKPMHEIDASVFRSSLAVVNQDIILFNDTVRENIRMWDKSIQDFEIIMAARDAQIYDDILQRPNGFDYVLSENGNDISGGQKQRIEIARTLAQDPTIICLDEATSALDAITEVNVVDAIAARGITCIVVAHRLSTIRDCDQIIVLDNGKIVDQGTHPELFARGGLYTELVTNE